MKNLKNYICESTECDELYDEIELTLKKFGNPTNGFKLANKQDIIDVMYQLGFDYDDTNSNDKQLTFVGDYIDNKYEVNLYIANQSGDKIKLRNFDVWKI